MPTLKSVQGVLSGVTMPMLLKYLENTFPNMNVLQITVVGKNEFSFVLQSEVSYEDQSSTANG